jgi:hypothetical protein
VFLSIGLDLEGIAREALGAARKALPVSKKDAIAFQRR